MSNIALFEKRLDSIKDKIKNAIGEKLAEILDTRPTMLNSSFAYDQCIEIGFTVLNNELKTSLEKHTELKPKRKEWKSILHICKIYVDKQALYIEKLVKERNLCNCNVDLSPYIRNINIELEYTINKQLITPKLEWIKPLVIKIVNNLFFPVVAGLIATILGYIIFENMKK